MILLGSQADSTYKSHHPFLLEGSGTIEEAMVTAYLGTLPLSHGQGEWVAISATQELYVLDLVFIRGEGAIPELNY